MSKLEKAIARLKSRPKDYKWDEAVALLSHLDFQGIAGSGSRFRFQHASRGTLILLHRPHPSPYMKPYAVKQLCETLEDQGLI